MNALLLNARVYTVNPRQPRATAIAIANDRIVAVGNDTEIEAVRLPGAVRIDMGGTFVLPGLIDAHVHLQHTGFALQQVDVDGVPSATEAIARVRARAAQIPNGAWIHGWGWKQNDWTPAVFPTAQDLDAATAHHPVALRAKSGHAIWVNSQALALAGITADTPNPPGGEIVRDASGAPTGVLLETAEELIHRAVPAHTHSDEDAAVIAAMRAMNQRGLTAVHCMDGAGGLTSFATYQRVLEQHAASLRVVKMLPVQDLDAIVAAGWRSGFGGDWLRIGNVKIFTDGALGPKTAWMAAPYVNEPDKLGMAIYDPEVLVEFTQRAHDAGLGVVVHAIGDRANHEMLNAIAASRATQRGTPHFRDRIEHAQVLLPEDIRRFAQLDVIASMQPIHCTSDMQMADQLWGSARARYAYAWQTLWHSGARLALGSDAPVEHFDPLVNIFAAVTRKRLDRAHAPEGWQNQERLTIDQAIYGFTLGAAYAGYTERDTGSIEAGKLADLTVLSDDLTSMNPDAIPSTKIERVMVGGEWVFER